MSKIANMLYFWLVSIMPPCDVIADQLSYSCENKLSLKNRIKLKIHLKTCRWCTNYGHQINFISDAMKFKADDSDSPGSVEYHLSENSKNRLKNILKDKK